MPKFLEQSRACDQCNMRRIRCTRQLPVCHACKSRSLTCSWNRQLSAASSQNYQNVETFSSTNQGKRYSKGKAKTKEKPVSVFKHYSFITQSLVIKSTDTCDNNLAKSQEKYPSLLVRFAPTVWSMALRKWLSTSSSRQDFYIIVKMSGVRLEVATRQDHKFLCHILLNRVAPDLVPTKMLLHVDILNDTNSLLELALDAYFHYFNPFCFLFTRSNFFASPRSQLLLLAVWLSGLQFLPQSPQKKALADTIDNLISSKIALSQLTPNLDTLQSLLIIGIGISMASSSRLHNKWPYFNAILSMTHLLGLHKTSSQSTNIQLERVLAYHVVLFWDAQRVWSLGFPFFTLGTYFSTRASNSRAAIKASFQLYAKQGLHFDAMDLCGLITSECLGNSSLSLLNLHHLDLRAKQANGLPVTKKIIKAVLQNGSDIYKYGSAEVRFFRNSQSHDIHRNSQVFDQTLCFLALCYHFSRLQILDYATQISSDTSYILKGISSAIHSISIIGRIGKGPFLFVRVNPLSCAFHFIVRYYHTYTSLHPRLEAPFVTPAQLLCTLADAFNILQELKCNALYCYHASSAITMFNALLVRHKITLPNIK
ncbi:hypothetical protein DSO57_1017890 [Entomophthora muscae]|uniref:Uncharacterized protein n=1 Tax=Entomophthora muscae TaxID=34485 RepID=A0ACC2UQB4_9FUNG|nr:hypothetical protein DSO57_1017890 [Entomophthora muscae]